MNNFDQTTNINLPGFEEYPEMKHSLLPDFHAVIQKRLGPTQQDLPGFDPHAVMVKKHKVETGEIAPDTTPVVQWPEKDMEVLNDFCKQHNILGFNCGRMSPIAAIAMLKQKFGYMGDTPLSERVPYGFEKAGTPTIHSANYPYSKPADNRKILNG